MMKTIAAVATIIATITYGWTAERNDDHSKHERQLVLNRWIQNAEREPIDRTNSHVTKLTFRGSIFSSLDFLAGFSNITSLTLIDNRGLTSIQPLIHLPLKMLDLSLCSNVRDLELLGQVTTLRELRLCRSFAEDDVPYPELHFIGRLKRLRKLDLSQNDSLPILTPLGTLPRLVKLNLYGSKGMRDLSALGLIVTLRFLNIHNLPLLQEVNFLMTLPNLEILMIDEERETPVLPLTVKVYS